MTRQELERLNSRIRVNSSMARQVDMLEEAFNAEREACAAIADSMAADLIERAIEAIDKGESINEITPQQVVNGYRMIAKLIRKRGDNPQGDGPTEF